MNNKKKIAFLSLAVIMGMVVGACNDNTPSTVSTVPSASSDPAVTSTSVSSDPSTASSTSSSVKTSTSTSNPSSSSSSSSSSSAPSSSSSSSSSSIPVVVKHTVKFVVNGVEVQSGQVEEGQLAAYEGEEPIKAADENAVKYRFKGWDKPLSAPIMEDTTFTAVFAEYAASQMVDDFEEYTSNGDIEDNGWRALGYHNDTKIWDTDTGAAVTLGTASVEGSKSLRFDAWENNVGYKFAKHLEANALPKSANALKFRLQVPNINEVKVILNGKVTIAGEEQAPSFTYTLTPQSSEFVEYVIPVADNGWILWGDPNKTIKSVADWTGVHEDDYVNYLTDIEFYVKGNDGIGGQKYFAFLDSIQFVTIDNPTKTENETMGQYTKYTGLLADGHTVKIELGANGSAEAKVLDMETPMTIPGAYSVDAQKVMTFTSADSGASLVYKARLVDGGQSMKFVSATGNLAEAAEGMDLNAVQVVDNFDQYTSDGVSYHQNNLDISQRSGCRGAYYSEYCSGGNMTGVETFGGDGWVLMGGDGSQLKLKNDGGHSGNNYVYMKNSGSFAMRYMQWGLYDGTSEQNNFRGSKLSFWAKTYGTVKSFKVSMYSQTKPRNATKDVQVKSATFTQTAPISEWTHYEVDLNPKLTYYGFLVVMDKNGSDAGLYLDDVEVYTANPYAEYVPEVPPVEQAELKNGQVFFATVGGIMSATLVIEQNNSARIDMPASNVSISTMYRMEDNQVEFNLGDYGTYVAELNEDASKLTYVSSTGPAAGFGPLTFNEIDVLDNAETYTESGKMYYQNMTDKDGRTGARGAYYCDYNTGNASNTSPVGGSGWSLMGGSGDQLSLSTDEHHNGNNSLKLKRNKSNTMRYMTWGLMDGTAEAHTGADYFMYFAKNPNSVELTIKTSVYYQQQVTPSTQQSNRVYVEAKIPANSDWTPVVIPLDHTKTYYGAAFVPATISGGSGADYFYIDDAMFYNEPHNVTAPFVSINGLKMDGKIAGGAMDASLTLGEHRNVTLTCAALGGDLDAKYSMMGTTMVIEVPAFQQGGSGTTIIGTYGASQTQGYMEFTVVSCTGDMTSYIAADTVFKGALA